MEQAGSFAQYRAIHWAESVGVIVVTSTIALSYNLVHSLMIQRTSAVATTVLGEIKIVGLMLASYLILGKWPSTTPACMARAQPALFQCRSAAGRACSQVLVLPPLGS